MPRPGTTTTATAIPPIRRRRRVAGSVIARSVDEGNAKTDSDEVEMVRQPAERTEQGRCARWPCRSSGRRTRATARHAGTSHGLARPGVVSHQAHQHGHQSNRQHDAQQQRAHAEPAAGAPTATEEDQRGQQSCAGSWTCRAILAKAIVSDPADVHRGDPRNSRGERGDRRGTVVRRRRRRGRSSRARARSNRASIAPTGPPVSVSPAMATRCTNRAIAARATITPARNGHRVADQSPTGADHTRLLPSPPGESCTTLGPGAALLTGQDRVVSVALVAALVWWQWPTIAGHDDANRRRADDRWLSRRRPKLR